MCLVHFAMAFIPIENFPSSQVSHLRLFVVEPSCKMSVPGPHTLCMLHSLPANSFELWYWPASQFEHVASIVPVPAASTFCPTVHVACAVQVDPVNMLALWYRPPGHASQVSVLDEPLPRKLPALQSVECAAHDDPVKLFAVWY